MFWIRQLRLESYLVIIFVMAGREKYVDRDLERRPWNKRFRNDSGRWKPRPGNRGMSAFVARMLNLAGRLDGLHRSEMGKPVRSYPGLLRYCQANVIESERHTDEVMLAGMCSGFRGRMLAQIAEDVGGELPAWFERVPPVWFDFFKELVGSRIDHTFCQAVRVSDVSSLGDESMTPEVMLDLILGSGEDPVNVALLVEDDIWIGGVKTNRVLGNSGPGCQDSWLADLKGRVLAKLEWSADCLERAVKMHKES